MKKVLVIGGGIAGLTAARQLCSHGVPVVVLEAKSRFGGRIHTVQDTDVPVELGAEFVHGENPALLALINEAKLQTQPVAEKNLVSKDARFQETPIWDIVGDIFNRIDPRNVDSSFQDFLSKQPVDEEAKDMAISFVQGFDAAHVDRISAHALLRAEYAAEQINGAKALRLKDGYSALVDYLIREIKAHGGELLPDCAAKKIGWEHGKVEVFAGHHRQEKTFNGDAAIIALPLGVLKANTVQFEPSLPDKQAAAEAMQFGNVMKIIFHFREPFWTDDAFFHAFDAKIPTWWNDPRGPFLVGWAGGPKADALQHLSHPELETLGLEILGNLFAGHPLAELRKRLIKSYHHNWADDADILGAYSYLPVNGLDLPKVLGEPVDETLFFAGEATVLDAQMGTVFGAVETGLRAANECLA